jgi:hypothetical protein
MLKVSTTNVHRAKCHMGSRPLCITIGMGAITLICTQAIVTNAWFCVFKILGEEKNPYGIFFT